MTISHSYLHGEFCTNHCLEGGVFLPPGNPAQVYSLFIRENRVNFVIIAGPCMRFPIGSTSSVWKRDH